MKKNTELGRTMLEMISVIGIISLLVTTGITGYNMAQTRFQATKIIDVASKLSARGIGGKGGTLKSRGLDSQVSSNIKMELAKDGTVTIKGLTQGTSLYTNVKTMASDHEVTTSGDIIRIKFTTKS